jgi:processive 1,2-diacylglycerol beta-glucosyltransferase
VSKRIAILSCSVGAGHLRAAQALAVTARTLHPDCVVLEQDVLELMPKPFVKLYRDFYLEMVGRTPEFFGWLYDQMDKPLQEDLFRRMFERANAGKFYDLIDDFKPDISICAHFLPASLLYRARRKGRYPGKLVTVVTDFDVHGMWLGTPADHLFLAVEEARVYVRSLGVDAGILSVTGIPTHPQFGIPQDREKVARELGLRSDLPTVLVSSGGFGVSNVGEMLAALTHLEVEVQVVAACGRNKELAAQLQKTQASPLVHILGFTDKIDLYMSCADVMLGKPGGLTTWESFTKGLAWVVVNPIPGQEERNTFHLLEEGIGVWAYEHRTLAYKLGQLLGNPARLKAMQENSRRLARPHAARDIIEKSLSLL